MPTVEVNGRRVGYVRRGSGVPLLLLQGMGGHHGMWGEQLLGALERDFDIVAVDHRGVGDSDAVPGDFTVADLADDVAAFLHVIGWDSAHVLGHSLGGMVAQELVLRNPERVRSLVLASTYPGGAGSDPNAPGPLSMLQGMQSGNVDVALRAAFAANTSAAYAEDEANYEAFKKLALAVPITVPTIIAQAQAAFFHNAQDRLAQVTVPTLILHAEDDQMVLYKNGQLLATLIPGARFHSMPDGGHLFWFARLDEVVQLIREHCLAAEHARVS